MDAKRKRSRGAAAVLLVGAAAALTALWILAGAAGAAAVPGTNVFYTVDAKFDQGTLVNVNHDAPNNDQLQLNKSAGTFPFIWVSLSQRCTIAKINTETGTILGEYRTIADSVRCNESSRTTVALDGSVWMGHRGPGGVTHVGLAELNQCLDRNGNGTIETSTGYGDVKLWPGSTSLVANAQDECILHHVDTDSSPLSFSDTRHMSIDKNNKLWVGDFGNHKFVRVNGTTGVVETAPRSFSCGGYGGLIDKNGVIWSANAGQVGLLRWNPDAPDSDTNPRCISIPVYGLAIDPNGFVWASTLSGNQVRKVSSDGNTILGPFGHGSDNAQGLAVTSNGDVWVSSSLFCGSGCTIGHLKNDGSFVGNVSNPTGAGSTGVAVDAAGKVWSANRASNTATRIDPNAGDLGPDGVTRIGAVDLTVSFPSGPGSRPSPFPYNYSDMTGAQLLGSTSPQGIWTVTQDGGASGTVWGKVTWNTEPEGDVPEGANIKVEARTADTEAGLGSVAFTEVANGTTFSMVGRFIQVRATLTPNGKNESPVLSDIRIQTPKTGGGAPPTVPADVGISKTDSPDPVTVGGEITYSEVVTNSGPAVAPNVTLTDPLPADVSLVSATPTTGSCSGTTTVVCSLGTLGVGGSATVTILVKANAVGTVTNTATVTADAPDENAANNSSTAETTVNPEAPLQPPRASCGLKLTTTKVFVGPATRIGVLALRGGKPAGGVRVVLTGKGIRKSGVTDRNGFVMFTVKTGDPNARLTVRAPGGCKPVRLTAGANREVRAFVAGGRVVRSVDCPSVSATPTAFRAGTVTQVVVRIRSRGRAVINAIVILRGAGVAAANTTGTAGSVSLTVKPTRAGIIRLSAPNVTRCVKRYGVLGAISGKKLTG